MKWVFFLSLFVCSAAWADESAFDHVLNKAIPSYLKKQDDYRTMEKRYELAKRKLAEKRKRIQARNPGVRVAVTDNGEVARLREQTMSIIATEPKTPVSNEDLKNLLDEIRPASYVSSQIYGGDLVIKLKRHDGEYEKRIPKSNYNSVHIWNTAIPTLDIDSLDSNLNRDLYIHVNTETKEADARFYRVSRTDLSTQKILGATSSFRDGTVGDVNTPKAQTHFKEVLEAYKKSHRAQPVFGDAENINSSEAK